jgi:hypothetical protein
MSRWGVRGSPPLHAAHPGMRVPVRIPRPVRRASRTRCRGGEWGGVRQRQRNPHPGQSRTGARGRRMPRQPGTRTPRRGRAARERTVAAVGPGPQRQHGGRGLLRTRRPGRGHPPGPYARRRLRLGGRRVRSGREHCVGHPQPLHPAGGGGSVDGLAGAPREHPGRPFQRHRRGCLHTRPVLDGARPVGRALHAGLRSAHNEQRRSV